MVSRTKDLADKLLICGDRSQCIAWVKRRDPTRLVDMHRYPEPSMHTDGSRASFLGEWGGIGLKVPGHLWAPDAWGYCEEPTIEAFEKRYLGMVRMLEDLAAKGLSGSVYTQATDCEREANGLITYDRRVPKVDPETVRAAHARVLDVLREGKQAD